MLVMHQSCSQHNSTSLTYSRPEDNLAFVAGKVVVRPAIDAVVKALDYLDRRISSLFTTIFRGVNAAKVEAGICSNPNEVCQRDVMEKVKAINVPLQVTDKPALLLLHFDINKTLTLKNSSKPDVTPEQMIASILAEFTRSKWDDNSEEMSFKEYVEQIVVPGDKWDPAVKSQRQKLIFGFLDWLKDKNHSLKDEIIKKCEEAKLMFTDPSTREIKFTVFQSFYELLNALRAQNIRIVVLLRSFVAVDVKEVAQDISAHPSGVNITRYGRFESKKLHLEDIGTVETVDKIYQTFVKSEEHFAINDNWKEWNDNKESANYSKLFPYDASGEPLSLFFDDNYSEGKEQDIINPIRVNGDNAEERKCRKIFAVHPLEAALNRNYYINLVNEALRFNGYTIQL